MVQGVGRDARRIADRIAGARFDRKADLQVRRPASAAHDHQNLRPPRSA
jgi:hypothetical protein